MPRMYKFFRQGVRLELRPLKGQRKGPASGEAAGPGRKMPMPWWRAWGRDLRGREEKAPRLGGIRCWPVCRPFLKESFTSCKELAGLRSEEHTSELQSPCNLVCRLLLEKKKKTV